MTPKMIQLHHIERRSAIEAARVDSLGNSLEAAILDLLRERKVGKTICPSEAARKVAPATWQRLLEPTRRAAHRLIAAGRIVATQHGQPVDISQARGPIRLRLRD
jgi:Protein of unknown function (DUF3253)